MAYFRHELKYLVTDAQVAAIETRMNAIMQTDGHAVGRKRKEYRLASMYFDDLADSCYYDNENGYDHREKWRIRIYNHSPEEIFLENKVKLHGMTHKHRCRLTKAETVALILGKLFWKPDRGLLTDFLYEKNTRGFHPTVITVYDRIPFIYPLGNVRITIDRNISSSVDFRHFFDRRLAVRPVLAANTHLLEVKYDEFLPSFIHQCLQTEGLQRTSFSKYYLCRRYSL